MEKKDCREPPEGGRQAVVANPQKTASTPPSTPSSSGWRKGPSRIRKSTGTTKWLTSTRMMTVPGDLPEFAVPQLLHPRGPRVARKRTSDTMGGASATRHNTTWQGDQHATAGQIPPGSVFGSLVLFSF